MQANSIHLVEGERTLSANGQSGGDDQVLYQPLRKLKIQNQADMKKAAEHSAALRSALPLGSSKNGWYANSWRNGRAVGTRHTAADCRVPKGTLSLYLLDPAIEMAGYPCQAPLGLSYAVSHRDV